MKRKEIGNIMEKEMFEKLMEEVRKERKISSHSYYRAGEYLNIIISRSLYKVKYTTVQEFARVELKTSSKTLENQVRVYRYLSKLSEKTRNYILDALPKTSLLYVVYLLEFGGDEFYDEEKLKKVVGKWEKLTSNQIVRSCKKLLGDKYPKPANPKRKTKPKIDMVPAGELIVAQNQLKFAQKEIKELKQQIEELQAEKRELQRQVRSYRAKFAGARSMMSQYQKEVEKYKAVVEKLQMEIKMLKQEAEKSLMQKLKEMLAHA